MLWFRSAHARRQAAQVLSIGLSVVIAFAPVAPLYAAPQGAEVVRGQASVHRDGNRMTIRASNGAILEYTRFDIASGEVVRFVQPNAQSRVLNRVTGGDVSHIAGQLQANGIVYLTNPAGVIFTPGAEVNVAGLYAAAGTLRDGDFLNGTDQFRNLQGEVVNHGQITSRAVHLIGERVANHGTITVDRGVVTMLAGDQVLLRDMDGRVSVKIDGVDLTDRETPAAGHSTPRLDTDPGVENTGHVDASQGSVTLGAGDMYSLAVRNRGSVDASDGAVNVAAADGVVHNQGELRAAGGSVTVQAPSAVNEGVVSADANDAVGGEAGQVEFTSRDHTYLLDDSVISANGGDGAADGGSILIHSYDGLTIFQPDALVDVSGGASGGSGGFAEVSGQWLAFEGNVDLAGTSGYGHLLIDPRDLTIADTGSHDGLLADGQITFNEPDDSTDVTISDEALEALTGHITLQADRDLYVNHTVDLVHDNDLTLEANNNLVFNATINGAFNLTATADADSSGAGTLTINTPLTDILGFGTFNGAEIVIDTPEISSRFSQTYNGPVTLMQDLTLGGTGVRFNDTLNAGEMSLNNPQLSPLTMGSMPIPVNLHVDDGSAVFAGDVGTINPLTSIIVDGAVAFDTPTIRTIGDQSYGLAATLRSDALLHTLDPTATVSFGDRVDAASAGDAAMTIDSNALFHGKVGQRALSSLHVTGTTAINGGLVQSTGQQLYEDDVTLGNDALLIGGELIALDGTTDGGHALTIESADGDIRFGDDVGASTPLASLEMNADGLITIHGERVHAMGDILVNPDGRAAIPTVATITAPDGSVTVRSTNGDFIMGAHEKFTALGDLTIDVADTATLGDMNSLGDMTVHANAIELYRRAAGDVLETDGMTRGDAGVDYVAGGRFDFAVAPTYIGSGAAPAFASPLGSADANGNLPMVMRNVALSSSDFAHEGAVLDLRPNAFEEDVDLAETFGDDGPIPFTDVVPEEVLLGPSTWQTLSQIALNIQPLGPDALRRRLAGHHVIDQSAAGGSQGISVYRIRAANAHRVLDQYLSLFVKQVRHEETGEIQLEDRTADIRTMLASAWQAYTSSMTDDAEDAAGQTGERQASESGFLAFLHEHQAAHAAALHDMQAINQMLHALRQTGITAGDYQRIRDSLLERITPEVMTHKQLRDVIDVPQLAHAG